VIISDDTILEAMFRALEQRDWGNPPDLYALFIEPREDADGWAVTAERIKRQDIRERGPAPGEVLSLLAADIETGGAARDELTHLRQDDTFTGIMYLDDARASRRITAGGQPEPAAGRRAVTVLRDGTALNVAQRRGDGMLFIPAGADQEIAAPLAAIIRALTGDS
jgi:hypothetical protein